VALMSSTNARMMTTINDLGGRGEVGGPSYGGTERIAHRYYLKFGDSLKNKEMGHLTRDM